MQNANLFLLFTRPLEEAGIDYMVTGSVAAMLYGEPRLTHDIDLVIELSRERVPEMVRCFPQENFYLPPQEVMVEEVVRAQRGHFNAIHHGSGFKADFYPMAGDLLHRWGMEHRERIPIEDTKIWAAPAAYVILRKLQYYREGGAEKHLGDIRAMLELAGDDFDREDLERRVDVLGLGEEWRLVDGG